MNGGTIIDMIFIVNLFLNYNECKACFYVPFWNKKTSKRKINQI